MDNKFSAVIVEDEPRSQIVLKNMLMEFCPEIDVVAVSNSVSTGISAIKKHDPAVLFLDIQLMDGTGFDILNNLDYSHLSVVFTTAYDQYAIKAFRFSAIDYLLKPLDIDELKSAVKKVTSPQNLALSQQKINHLIKNISRDPNEDPVLLISTADTVEFIHIREIVRCQADGAYCKVFMQNGEKYIASKVIKEFELLLQDYGFYRVHQSHLVNLRELKKFSRSDFQLILRDGTKIQLARSRRENLFKAWGRLRI